MAMEKVQTKLTVIMFPWLAHGHITPFLQLSKKLSQTNHFTIHFCSTSINLDSIRQALSEDDDLRLVELCLPSTPELPPELHTTKNLPHHLLPILLKTFQESSSSFSHIFDSLKPHLLIYDVFQPWAAKIASSKGVPSVLFSSSGAASVSFFHYVYLKGSSVDFPFPALHLPQHEMDRIRNRIVPNLKLDGNDSKFGMLERSTDIVLMRSCKQVEDKYLDYLSVTWNKEIVCTGPLVLDFNTDDDQSFEIMEWLSSKSHRSTLYISFGSECFPSKDQLAELAKGLRFSNVNFLWVVRFPGGTNDIEIEDELPWDFIHSVKERGLVLRGWAPQTKILGHPSIGGFVSHCGWGSFIESMYYGVPIIAMPMKSEQPINAQLVSEAGVGVEVRKDDSSGIYSGEEVAKVINIVMVEKAEDLRNAARRLSEAIREKEDRDVVEVAEKLVRICMKYKKEE